MKNSEPSSIRRSRNYGQRWKNWKKEVYADDFEDGDEEEEEEYRKRERRERQKRKKKRGPGRGVTIAALILGAVLLIAVVVIIIKSTGLLEKKRARSRWTTADAGRKER